MENNVIYNGLKILPSYIENFKDLLKNYESLRFCHNPMYWRYGPFYEIKIKGNGKDISKFIQELGNKNWEWKNEK